MKKCIRCGKLFDNRINYCTNCGSSNFYEEDENSFQEDEGTEELSRYTEKGFASISQSNVNSPTVSSKKKNWWKIISIVLVSIFLFFVVLLIIPTDDTFDDSYYDDISTTIEKVEYTKGSVVEGCYLNEWANFKLCIPEEWSESGVEGYQMYEDSKTDCGFAATKGNDQLAICFEDLLINVSEEEYLEIVTDNVKTSYSEYDAIFEVSEYYDFIIADANYKVAKITIGSDAYHQYFCVKRIDNYMAIICVNTEDDDSAKAILGSIESIDNF